MDLIDTHQHLIYRDRVGYGWTAGVPVLASGDFTLQHYQALTAGKGIVGSIFMEVGVDDADYRAEAEMVAGLIGTGGVLGQVASIRPEEDAGFDDWLDQAGRLGIVGYRRLLHVVDQGISGDPIFRRNLRKIGAKGLPFDLVVFARQLGLAEDLIRACPDQQFVLDHCGNPDVAGGGFAPWAESIRRLAAFPNLVVKLSGITTNCAAGQVTVAVLRPYVDHLLACFGPDRMLWGGDWPVVNLATGLPDWIDLTRALLAGLSEPEQYAIGQGTARRIYKV